MQQLRQSKQATIKSISLCHPAFIIIFLFIFILAFRPPPRD